MAPIHKESADLPLEVISPGLLTLVQDLGRWQAVQLGVPISGPMDPFGLMAANALVENPVDAAVLEITLLGPELIATEGCRIAVTGADLGLHIGERPAEGWRTWDVDPGSRISFAGRRSGARAYLAVAGGIAVPPWLGSRSTYLRGRVGGFDGRPLRTGDRLPIGPSVDSRSRGVVSIPPNDRPPYSGEPTLRVIPGPHADRFTERGLKTFVESAYVISPQSDRMGYRLEGPQIEHSRGADVSSCGIPLGAIQVPGNGQPILLMADHQTVGGYPMIAAVVQADIPLAGQCLPGDTLRFRLVSLLDAREALRRQMQAIPGRG